MRHVGWLSALGARRFLREPDAETFTTEHLLASRFDDRVHEWFVTNGTHKFAVVVVIFIHKIYFLDTK